MQLKKELKQIKEGDTISIRFPLYVDEDVLKWANLQTSTNTAIISLIEKEIKENGIRDISKDIIPTEKELWPHVLACIAQNSNNTPSGVSVQDIYDYCAAKLNVTPQLRSIPTRTNESKFENRVRFTILKLKEQKLIVPGPKRGFYKITNLGKDAYDLGATSFEDFQATLEANYVRTLIDLKLSK